MQQSAAHRRRQTASVPWRALGVRFETGLARERFDGCQAPGDFRSNDSQQAGRARVPQQLHPRPQDGGHRRMKLTHLDTRGKAKMVDVSTKPVQLREAVARGSIRLQLATLRLIKSNRVAKGDVLNVA